MARIGLIGAGVIGTELVKQARDKGFDVGPVLNTSGVYDISKLQSWDGELSKYLHAYSKKYKVARNDDYLAPLKDVDAVFLAIPTSDNGETAYRYMSELFAEGKPVVTCEKGALSLHFKDLLESFERGMLGYRASVGGGTSMLKYLQERVRPSFDGKVYAIVNGTLNFWLDGVASGRSSGEMITEAKKLKYAEPGAESALDIVNEESCGDIPRKSVILFNTFLYSMGERKFLDIGTLQATTKKISSEMLRELIRQAGNRRYIVSIKRPDSDREEIIGGYSLEEFRGWKLEGGFRHISGDPLYQRLLTKGVDNAILIAEGKDESKGVYNLRGPGAGPEPTAAAMLRDLNDMYRSGIIKS